MGIRFVQNNLTMLMMTAPKGSGRFLKLKQSLAKFQ